MIEIWLTTGWKKYEGNCYNITEKTEQSKSRKDCVLMMLLQFRSEEEEVEDDEYKWEKEITFCYICSKNVLVCVLSLQLCHSIVVKSLFFILSWFIMCLV